MNVCWPITPRRKRRLLSCNLSLAALAPTPRNLARQLRARARLIKSNANQNDENIAKTAEKQKKNFAGTEISGKKLGVIGLGAIGVLVANAAVHMGMDVYGYDPYISVNAAWNLSRSVKHISNVEDIYKNCDVITIHVPLLDSTKKMINADAIAMMKPTAIVLNFARDLLALFLYVSCRRRFHLSVFLIMGTTSFQKPCIRPLGRFTKTRTEIY